MKKTYVQPTMESEIFVANEFVGNTCYQIICDGYGSKDIAGLEKHEEKDCLHQTVGTSKAEPIFEDNGIDTSGDNCWYVLEKNGKSKVPVFGYNAKPDHWSVSYSEIPTSGINFNNVHYTSNHS